MGLIFKPHTATVQEPDDSAAGGYTTIGTSRGQLTPEKSARVLENYGVSLERPHTWLCDPSDEALLKQGNRLVIAGRKYNMERPAEVFRGIGLADNASVLVDEVVDA